MDDNNKKIFQKIVGNFLYYAREVDPTMLMALNAIEAVQTNQTIKTMKQVTKIFNDSATNPDAKTEYIRSRIILHIYSDA